MTKALKVMVAVALMLALSSGIAAAATLGGTDGGDEIQGTKGADGVKGLAGDDILDGRGGGDALFGNGGRDLVTGGSGDDRIVGGAGNDHFGSTSGESYDEPGSTDKISCGPGFDTVSADRADSIADDCEEVTFPNDTE